MTGMKAVLATLATVLSMGIVASATAQNLSKNSAIASDTAVGRVQEAPVNTRPEAEKFWFDNKWYLDGQISVPVNHDVVERAVSYVNPEDDTEVPATLFRPKGEGKFPAILFQHGRRGLDAPVARLAKRMAARGFIVLAPDVYSARFIEKRPLEHMVETEGDVNAGVDFLLAQPEVSTSKICLYSHTRGGFYTLKVSVKYKRQESDVACYVSFYPHWQNPNATEPEQVYRYDAALDKLTLPTIVFIGEYEQYQRRRSIETAVSFMKSAGRDIKLIIYPGVGRGFDFRTPNVRTFADDLATKDATQRAAAFFRKHLEKWKK